MHANLVAHRLRAAQFCIDDQNEASALPPYMSPTREKKRGKGGVCPRLSRHFVLGTCKQPVNSLFLHNLPSLSITFQGPKNPISEFITVCQKQKMLQLGLPCRPSPGGGFLGPMCLESKQKTQRQWKKKHNLDPNHYFVPTSFWNLFFFSKLTKKTKQALHGVQMRRPLFLVRGI